MHTAPCVYAHFAFNISIFGHMFGSFGSVGSFGSFGSVGSFGHQRFADRGVVVVVVVVVVPVPPSLLLLLLLPARRVVRAKPPWPKG
jgi:hypothetical protein